MAATVQNASCRPKRALDGETSARSPARPPSPEHQRVQWKNSRPPPYFKNSHNTLRERRAPAEYVAHGPGRLEGRPAWMCVTLQLSQTRGRFFRRLRQVSQKLARNTPHRSAVACFAPAKIYFSISRPTFVHLSRAW